MRKLIDREPFLGKRRAFFERGIWPASWIGDPQVRGQRSAVTAFRLLFSVNQQTQVTIHVSADERYELFLDGRRIGRGPERSDPDNWCYETFVLDLAPGQRALVARTWWIGPDGGAPYAQMSVRPGFLLAAEGSFTDELSTGIANWESKPLPAYQFLPVDPRVRWVGAKLHIHGPSMDWDVGQGAGDRWQPAEIVGQALSAALSNCTSRIWRLRPAALPHMLEQEIYVGTARHVQKVQPLQTQTLVIRNVDHLPEEAAAWNQLLRAGTTVAVPANAMRRIIIDLDNYYCAYPQLITSKGAGASIRIHWAESLFENSGKSMSGYRDENGILVFPAKGNRDQIENKIFDGVGDLFETDGGNHRHFQTFWWHAGRYLEIVISTAAEPLVIEKLSLLETRYPHNFESHFESSDSRLAEIIPPALRTLEMCSHETYMDCPYYEQLMYVGDTRLEALTTYAISADDRLPRKAILMFDISRRPDGLTQAQYPSRTLQIIPPFSLWWIAMVHDYAMWRDDRGFVAEKMPGVRGVLDAFGRYWNGDGLLGAPEGWNFTDWAAGWADGVPPAADNGVSALLNFQLVWTTRMAAELEDAMGEPELAARNRRRADSLARAATAAFWDESRGLYSDDLSHQHFSEHTQCLALLGGSVPEEHRARVAAGLLADTNLTRTTIYFLHYLFETYRMLRRPEEILDRMGPWFELKRMGLRTTPEMPEPTRSDCHGWGAHPVFHFHASILGVRPAEPGFGKVRIEPQLGPLTWARGTIAHPKGTIRAEFSLADGRLSGEIELPAGVTGTLLNGGSTQSLNSGMNRF